MSDQLTQLLNDLMGRLGTTAQDFWPVYVRYTYATHLMLMIVNLVGCLVASTVFVVAFVLFRRGWIKAMTTGWSKGNDPSPAAWLVICSVVVCIVSFCVAASTFGYAVGQIPALMVPEAQAASDILTALRSSK